jgi:hypothetical protein
MSLASIEGSTLRAPEGEPDYRGIPMPLHVPEPRSGFIIIRTITATNPWDRGRGVSDRVEIGIGVMGRDAGPPLRQRQIDDPDPTFNTRRRPLTDTPEL